MTKSALVSIAKAVPWLILLLSLPFFALWNFHHRTPKLTAPATVAPTGSESSKVSESRSASVSSLGSAKPSSITSSLPAHSPSAQPQSSDALKALQAQQRRQLASAIAPNIDALVEMHVALVSRTKSLIVSHSGSILDQTGKFIKTLSAKQVYTVEPTPQGMSIGSSLMPNIIWVVPQNKDNNGTFSLNQHSYRGTLLIVSDGDRLWAVNYINLRQYLYSVVGAEVSSSWPPQALKAQAIAARSYALTYFFKPVNQLFHLGSDEYFQVYKGTESEAAPIQAAVDETVGEFVSYRGGIVESLYAASDDIVADAFQGHGMSQLGALSLAQQGYNYHQILATYYPKTGVGRIAVDQE